MKTIYKRVLSLIVVICLCMTTIPKVFDAFATEENGPKLSSKCEMIIEENGIDAATFGVNKTTPSATYSASNLRLNTKITFSAYKDLSNADIFELNVFVEDVNTLKSYVNDDVKFALYFSSNNRGREQQNCSYANISEQITTSGWNTVVIEKSKFSGSVNWGKVYIVYLGFTDETVAMPQKLATSVVKYKNLCDILDCPDVTDDGNLIYEDVVINTLGETQDSVFSDTANRFNVSFDSKDISKNDIIKVDFYVPDYAKHNALLSGGSLIFYFVCQNGKLYTEIDDLPTSSGWYSVQIVLNKMYAEGNFDFSNVQGAGIEFTSDSAATLGDYYSMKFAFANIRGFKYELPSVKDFYGELVAEISSGRMTIVTGNNYYKFVDGKIGSFSALSSARYIEFDLYVSNVQNFRNAFLFDAQGNSLNASWNLILNSQSGSLTFENVEKQIITNGWNHIILPISNASNNNFNLNEKFESIYLSVNGVVLSTENAVSGDLIIADQFIATKGNAAKGETKFDKMTTISSDKQSFVSDTFDNSNFSKEFETIDITGSKYIEFDIYIQNLNAFKTMIAQKGITDISFEVSSLYGSVSCDILNLITESGWNHINIPYSRMLKNEQGSFDFATVNKWSIVYNGTSNLSTDLLQGQMISINNVIASKVVSPKLPSNAQVIISEEGKSGVYGDLYSNITQNSELSLETPVDTTVASNIEFDFYVEDYEEFKAMINASSQPLYFVLGTAQNSSNGRALYKFTEQVTDNGWNHIVLQSKAYSIISGDAAVDLKEVKFAYLSFSGNNGANSYPDVCFEIINICVVPALIDFVPTTPDYDIDISLQGVTHAWGEVYSKTTNRLSVDFSIRPLDLSDVEQIEFDIYIEDYDAFKSAVAGKRINFALSSNDVKTEDRARYDFENQITHSGWNHIVLGKNSHWQKDSKFAFEEVKWAMIFFQDGGENVNPIGDTIVRISNIGAYYGEYYFLPEIEKYSIEISLNGITHAWGDVYSKTTNRLSIDLTSNPINLSDVDRFEFDLYIENYDEFKSAVAGRRLNFALSSNDIKTEDRARYDFVDQITHSGWNHIVIKKGSHWAKDKDFKFGSVKWAMLFFQDGGEKVNPIGSTTVRFANIVANYGEYYYLPEAPRYEVELSKNGVTHTWGDQYNWTIDRLYINLTENPVDISYIDQLEFDIYIEDYDSFKTAVKKRRINFVLGSNDIKTEDRVRYDIEDKITHSGWNHIVLSKGSHWAKDSKFSFENVKWIMVTFQDGGKDNNPIATAPVRIGNIVGSYADYHYLPELPKNIIAQLGNEEDGTNSRGNTVGDYYHYTLDRIYQQKLSPVDFSKSSIIEFDIYISDYEKMIAADNDPTDKQDSKLSFVVSSTKPALWEQYTSPRSYYSSSIDLAEYITHSGWNHIKIGKSEFKTKNHGVDWSGLTAYYVYYRGSSNVYPYKNNNSDLYVKIANVVNTGVIAEIPADKDKELQPDKNVVYISSVEGKSDDNGAWNIIDPIISTKYKTAGMASIHKMVNYNSTIEDTPMCYVFDGKVDMSDLKTLKFDFFVDLPQYLIKPTNNIEVCIANNRFVKSDYYAWNMNLNNLKQGWNEITLNFDDASVFGNPDVKEVRAIMLRFTKIGLSSDEFEEIVIGIDNMRYVSSTGNTILNIEGRDEQPVEDEQENEEPEIDVEPEVEIVEKVINKNGKVKYRKIIEKKVVTDWLYAGIIVGSEIIVISAAVLVFIIIISKKNRKKKQ